MSIGNCDCCDRKNVPVRHHETDYERGHVGDVTQCYVCAGDVPDPYGEMDDETVEGSPAWKAANGQFGVGA